MSESDWFVTLFRILSSSPLDNLDKYMLIRYAISADDRFGNFSKTSSTSFSIDMFFFALCCLYTLRIAWSSPTLKNLLRVCSCLRSVLRGSSFTGGSGESCLSVLGTDRLGYFNDNLRLETSVQGLVEEMAPPLLLV